MFFINNSDSYIILGFCLMFGVVGINLISITRFFRNLKKGLKSRFKLSPLTYFNKFLITCYILIFTLFLVPFFIWGISENVLYFVKGDIRIGYVAAYLSWGYVVMTIIYFIFYLNTINRMYLYIWKGYLIGPLFKMPLQNITSINISKGRRFFYVVYYRFEKSSLDHKLFINNKKLDEFICKIVSKKKIIHHRYSKFN